MVALVAGRKAETQSRTQRRLGWMVGGGAVIAVSVCVKLALGGGGVGDRSAAVMLVLLAVPVWLAASMLISTPRTGCVVVAALVVLLDLASLPVRNAPEYDERLAFYRTDQLITATVGVPASVRNPRLTLLVEPVLSTMLPEFALAGLAGEVGGMSLQWRCPFRSGIQRLSLPVPADALAGRQAVDARLHLTGSPSRDKNYLLVYASSQRRGLLMSIASVDDVEPGSVTCAGG